MEDIQQTLIKLCNNYYAARKFQIDIYKKASFADNVRLLRLVAGLDSSYKDQEIITTIVVYDMISNKIVEKHIMKATKPCKYKSTFLFLREVPTFLEVMKSLKKTPDCCLVDGHGIAHPYHAGSATVFGVLADIPTIGIAKKPLKDFKIIHISKRYAQIYVKNKFVGVAIYTTSKTKPIYISPGNKITIAKAIETVNLLLKPHIKLPIPLYLAHKLATFGQL
ncbi:MAG: endonuclease V [Candidatus Heimdallarchaeaceae archaeon]